MPALKTQSFSLEPHRDLGWRRRLGCDVQTGTSQSRFVLCSVHIFTLYFTRVSSTVQMRAAALLYVTRLLLITVRTQVPQTSLPRLLAGWSERDAWSLWSVSQQQTVHTSRQCLGVVAHFRTSVHDTVSVVTLSSLVPHQRLTSCTFVSVHTCVQVPKLNKHTHTSIHSHTSPY